MKKLLALYKDVQKNKDVCNILTTMQFSDENGGKNIIGIQNINNTKQGICVVGFQGD